MTLAATFVLGVVALARRKGPAPAAGVVLLVLCALPLLPDGYMNRIGTITNIEEDATGSAQGRWRDTKVAAGLVVKNPIIGAGIGQDILVMNNERGIDTWRRVHNAYLQYGVDLGLPGLLLFVWLHLTCYRTARAVEKRAAADPSLRELRVLAAGVTDVARGIRRRGDVPSNRIPVLFLLRGRTGRGSAQHLQGRRHGAAAGVERAMSGARVLKVVPTLMCGGTENQFMMLSRAASTRRASTSSSHACGAGDRSCRRSRNGASRYRNTRSHRSAAYTRSRSRRSSLGTSRAGRMQIVHAYNFYGNVFAIPPARFAAPVVIASIRDCAPYLTPMQKRVQRYVCQLADCVLVNAEAVKDWLVDEGYDESKIVVIRNGVDLTQFTGSTDSERDSARAPANARHAARRRGVAAGALERPRAPASTAAAILKPRNQEARSSSSAKRRRASGPTWTS